MNKYFAVASISISALILITWILVTYSVSSIRIIDPVDEQVSIPAQHDIVVVHKGCGDKAEAGSFSAILDKGAASQRDISTEFKYKAYEPSRNGIQERWVADEFKWPVGQHSLTISANVPGNLGCFFVFNEHEIKLTVTEFLEPGNYKGFLHDSTDVDQFFFKAKKTGFGSWFHFSAKAENPADLELYFRLIGPAGHNVQDQKQAKSNLWVALADDVTASFNVSRGNSWPLGLINPSYTIDVLSQAIPDNDEPNEEDEQAKSLPRNVKYHSYMTSVLNDNDKAKGLQDTFFFKHTMCTVVCAQVETFPKIEKSSEKYPYYLEYISPAGGNDNDESNTVCTGNQGSAEEIGNQFITIKCNNENDCKPYGVGTIPARYSSTYSLFLEDKCTLSTYTETDSDGSTTIRCDWDGRPDSCK